MGTPTRRPYSPRRPIAERREQILDAALALIARDGYGGVSIDAIAREAGVTRPVIYRVFADLDALLQELLDRQERRALRQLAQALPLDGTDLIAGLRRLIETVRADSATWRPILLASEGTPAPVRERIDRERETVRQLLAAAIAGYAPDLDPAVTAHALVAVAEHFGGQILIDPDGFDPEPLLATARALLERMS